MPDDSSGRRWTAAVVLVVVLALAAGVAGLVLVFVDGGAEAADPLASVVAAALAAMVAAAGVLAWARRRRQASLPATAEQVDQATATLAGLVREQWQEEARARALGDPDPMPVRWRLSSPALMDHPPVIMRGAGELTFAGRSDRIGPLTDQFRALPRRRLVITGPPGSGKTTLAVQLLLELLPPPGTPPDGPVPVLFSLTGWTPDRQPRVQDWLTEQLDQTYPALRAIAPDAVAALVAQGRVLPVLDGLDEVAPDRRSAIISALNTSLDGGAILTSRRGEYRDAVTDAGDVLTGAAVIAPLALTSREATTFLRTHLPPEHDPEWDGVLDALETGRAAALAAVTASPLGLWLVRTVYIDDRRPPGPLTDGTYGDTAALRAHLLDELIPAVVRSRPPLPRRRHDAPEVPLRPTRQHRPEDLRRWLTTLAEQLRATEHRPRTSDWAWWELARHTFPTRRSRVAIRALVGVAIAAVVGLAFGSAAGLAFGLAFGLTGGLALRLTESPQHANLRLAGRIPELLKQLTSGLAIGLIAGPAIGVAAGLPIGVATGLAIGVGGWLMVGLTVGLADFVGSRDVAERSVTPTRSYRGDRMHSTGVGLAGGLMLGLAGGLPYGPAIGLTAGLAGGLAWIIGGPSFAFSVAASRQSAGRRLPTPWRVMAVLEDCHRLGLLRTVGPVYQFRHAELQDHLAPPTP